MSTINTYFDLLGDWKKLPAYKAETRVDSIAGFALEEIFAYDRDVKIVAVIPELPLRIGTIRPSEVGGKKENRSYKVDFFTLTDCGKGFLVEFKTDSASRRDGQDEYLTEAQDVGLEAVLTGIIRLYEKSDYKKKYCHLLDKLVRAGVVTKSDGVYTPLVQFDDLSIVYMQPHVKETDVGLDIVDFETVAGALENIFEGDEFMLAAARAFRGWAVD